MRLQRIGHILIVVITTMLLGACSERKAEPPSQAELQRLAAEDAKRYTADDQCLTSFHWPVTTTAMADGSPSWFYLHDQLEALKAIGLAKKSVRNEKVNEEGVTVTRSSLVYELTDTAEPFVRVKDVEARDGTPPHREGLLCLGRLTYDGNVTLSTVAVPKDDALGFLFHESSNEYHYAYREDNGTIDSRLEYTLQPLPTRKAFPGVLESLGTHALPDAKANDDAYQLLYDATFRFEKVSALVSDSGKGWANENSSPVSSFR